MARKVRADGSPSSSIYSFLIKASLFILGLLFLCSVYFLLIIANFVVSTSTSDCLERLVSEMIYYALNMRR